ncbi:unnamed protein product [Ectocarpus sp. CCAP 1310/34]|nr:unnamed protein product [Ectocarpus sp. CCAP 1310/34]
MFHPIGIRTHDLCDQRITRIPLDHRAVGVEMAKDCSWNADMSKVAEKGKARAGKLHPILANRHLDTRIKLTVLKSVIVPPLDYAGAVWEGNKNVGKELEAVQMKVRKNFLGCSKRTRPSGQNWGSNPYGREETRGN